MKINHRVVVFDTADLASESAFWAGVLGGTVDAESDWHMVLVDGAPVIGVQLAPDHVPPDWPSGTPPQQIHLDLWVESFQAAHDKVMSLGARVLQPAGDTDSADNFQVYADPAGHPFCLCWLTTRGSATVPGSAATLQRHPFEPGDAEPRLDQGSGLTAGAAPLSSTTASDGPVMLT